MFLQAGSSKVIELHGTNSVVRCCSCQHKVPRHAFQAVLEDLNGDFAANVTEQMVRPDGDTDIPKVH